MKARCFGYAILLASIFYFGCNVTEHNYEVKQGPFLAAITETGELQAISSKLISMGVFFWEYGEPKITELAKEGITVKKGDVVGRLDTSGVVTTLGQKRIDLAIAKADYETLLVNQISKKKLLQSELKSAEAALIMARIDTQRVRFESPTQKEISHLNFKIAEINYQKTMRSIEHSKITQIEDLKIQKQKLKRLESQIVKAKNAINQYTLYAPAKGMVEYQKSRRKRKKIGVGDAVGMGEAILGLPDLSRMKVVASVIETDIEKVFTGQKVYVRLDAFPQKVFDGSITKIAKMCKPKEKDSKIKVFEIEILLEQSDPILRPGMTVSCEIITTDLDKAIFVDNNCVQQDKEGYFLLIADGSASKRVDITLGPRNSKYVIVQGDVKAGDKIVTNENIGQA